MHFNKNEIQILRHMASFNDSITFHVGNKVWTNTHPFAVFMCLNVETDIPVDFSVLNLSTFIQAIHLTDLDNYQIIVEETSPDIYVMDAKNRTKFIKANPDFIKIQNKPINFILAEVTFDLTAKMVDVIKKAKSMISGNIVQFTEKGITIFDSVNPSNGEYVFNESLSDTPFSISLDVENFNVLTGDYTVTMPPTSTDSPIMKLESKDGLYYYILLGLMNQ